MPADLPAGSSKCPIHRLLRAGKWVGGGSALVVGLIGLKCILLYVVAPSVLLGAGATMVRTSNTGGSPAAEGSHGALPVPPAASCPLGYTRSEPSGERTVDPAVAQLLREHDAADPAGAPGSAPEAEHPDPTR